MTWHPSGELLASASYDNTIRLWVNDGDEWVCSQTLGGERMGEEGREGRTGGGRGAEGEYGWRQEGGRQGRRILCACMTWDNCPPLFFALRPQQPPCSPHFNQKPPLPFTLRPQQPPCGPRFNRLVRQLRAVV